MPRRGPDARGHRRLPRAGDVLTITARRLGWGARRRPAWGRDDRGQAALMLIVVMFFFAVAGLLVVDGGLAFTDRRDAQNDVDRAALAGAIELKLDPTQTSTGAYDAAHQWLINNDYARADAAAQYTIDVVRNCYNAVGDGYYDGVRVTVSRTPPTAGFLALFGLNWETGASALACAGRLANTTGFLPFFVSMSGPSALCYDAGALIPGNRCAVRLFTTPETGLAALPTSGPCDSGKPSGSDVRTNIAEGSQITCGVGDLIRGASGAKTGPVKQGLGDRLSGDGACEQASAVTQTALTTASSALNSQALARGNYALAGTPSTGNGIDDLFEIWSQPDASALDPGGNAAANVAANGCASVRNVLLIVINDITQPDQGGLGNAEYEVRGFIRGYLEGCDDGSGGVDTECSGNTSKNGVYIRILQQLGAAAVGELGDQAGTGDIGVYLRQ